MTIAKSARTQLQNVKNSYNTILLYIKQARHLLILLQY